MGNMFSHSGNHDDAGGSSSGLKRQPSDHAGAAGLKQSIAQNMRLSKSKVTSLLKANHMNYSVVHRNHFYNTLSHHIGAAYLFGAAPQRLFDIFDGECKTLEPWSDSPHEVTRVDWNRYTGDKRYARAYLDFFEDEVVRSNYDWKRVVQRYVVEGDEPLLSGMISGACHPLIHLAYAYELNNVEVATEALAVACIDRDFLYKYIDAKQKYKTFTRTTTPSTPSKSLLEILNTIRQDARFDSLFESPGYWNIPILFASREETVLEYFNLWTVTRADQNLEELFDISILLLAATTPAPSYPVPLTSEKSSTPPQGHTHFDFFLLHLLLSCHAIRVLFKNLSYTTHTTLLEAQFLATIGYYISELRPGVSIDLIKGRGKEEDGKDWGYIRRQCFESDVNSEIANGGNYVRGMSAQGRLMIALRVLREAELEYGFKDGLYLSTALMIVEQMNGLAME